MFIIDLLVAKNPHQLTAEVELICPSEDQADAAEEALFYGANAPKGMLFVRLSPVSIRMNLLDYTQLPWQGIFWTVPDPDESDETHRNILNMGLPPTITINHLHVQSNAILARVHCDVASYRELSHTLRPRLPS